MKFMKRFGLVSVLAIFSAVLLFGAQNYQEPERIAFVPKSGEWNNAKNWNKKQVPRGYARVYIPAGHTVTISGPVDITESLLLGSINTKEPGVVYVTRGAKAKLSALGAHASHTHASGIVYMEDGELSMGNDEFFSGYLMAGNQATCAGNLLMEIRGGEFTGGMVIGSSVSGTQVGTVRIIGSKPRIGTHPKGRNYLVINDSGTLEFVLDAKGVATMDYRPSRFMPTGGVIRVDGKDYKGPPTRIPLIVASKFGDQMPKIEVVNFADTYEATVFPEISGGGKTETLVLKIAKAKKKD